MSSPKAYPPTRPDGAYVNRGVLSKHRILLTRAVRVFFEQQIEPLAAQIGLHAGLAKIGDNARQAGDAVGATQIDWQPLAETVEPYLAVVAVAGGELAVDRLDADPDERFGEGMRVRAREWAQQRAAELVGMRREGEFYVPNPNAAWAIDATTRDMLRTEVEKAIKAGDSTTDLARRLRNAYAFSDERARMIARTEVARADSYGALLGWAASGVVTGKFWQTAEDDRVSKACVNNQLVGPVALDWDYGDGVMAPPEHPNCRCTLLPEVLEPLESLT
jgi:SPP1 gp7 family putative phage head morphogenesis protein